MNTWSEYHEKLLKKWSEMSKTYCIMHQITAQWYATLDKYLGIPVIVLGAITASSIFSTKDKHSDYVTYVNGGLVLVMTALKGVSNFIGSQEKQVKHQTAAFKYTSIGMNIDMILSFPRSDRMVQPEQFLNDIKIGILEIKEYAPDIPPWVINQYIKKLDKSLTNTRTQVNRTTYTAVRAHHPHNDIEFLRGLESSGTYGHPYYPRTTWRQPLSPNGGDRDSGHIYYSPPVQSPISPAQHQIDIEAGYAPPTPQSSNASTQPLRDPRHIVVEMQERRRTSQGSPNESSPDDIAVVTDFNDSEMQQMCDLNQLLRCDTDNESLDMNPREEDR